MATYTSYGPLDSQIVPSLDTHFLGFNTRLRPDQLLPGELAYSQNGRMGVDGAWQVRPGIDAFGPTLGNTLEGLVVPFYVYASKNVSGATRSTTTVTVTTTSAHGFTTGTQVGIAGLTGVVDPNGNRTITVTGSSTFTFTISGATGSETYTGAGTAGAPFVSANINGCFGSCLFSDPRNSNSEYIILATNDKALAVNRSTGTSTDITYPSGVTITGPVDMRQTFDKVLIFRDGLTALSWDGVLTGSPAFAKVSKGAYTATTYYNATNNTSIADGIVTVSETGHGLSVGQKIYVIDNATNGLLENSPYTIATVPDANTFTFYAQIPDHSTHSVVYSVKMSEGRGFTHMPAPAWGVYHQRRLIVPFKWSLSSTETITARNVSDEILFSDVLDSNTYDQLQNSFRVTAGIADYVQTVHPFTDDAAVAFNRNSIHLITGLSGALTDIEIKTITKEAGLVARNSVVTIGNEIYFLSDNGVYAASFGDLYNLRGAGLPLSDSINSVIKRINTAYAYRAVGIFHDNRYWLAVPLDSSMVNNALLIYNVLNKKWESVDVVNLDGFDINNLIVSGNGSFNKLFAINSFGGIHVIDSRVDAVDRVFTQPGIAAASYPISSYATTRQYIMESAERKKFLGFELHAESSDSNDSDATISVEVENPDSTATLGTLSGYLGAALPVSEDASIRGRIGNMRGYGIQLSFTPTQGRPKLRMVRVNAVPAFMSTNQAS